VPALLLRLAICGPLLAFSVSAASAQADADLVGARLVAAAAATERATLTYDGATATGDSVTVTGVTLTAKDGTAVTIPSIVFSGIVDRPAGGFFAALVTADAGTAGGETRTATWATATFDQVIVPSPDEIASGAPVTPFLGAAIGGINLGGDVPIGIASATASITSAPDGSPSGISARASGVKIPAALFANSVAGVLLTMMQYQEFVADITLDGSYDSATGGGALQRLAIDVPETGRISLSGQGSGIALADAVSPDPEISKEARASARLDQLTLRLDNAGFVERLLDAQAKMLGGTRDDIRAQLIGGALPLALSFVKNEPFRAEFLAAATVFLQNPRSLTIAFRPAEPVPLGQVFRTAARAPMTLPDLLSPAVEANTVELQ